MSKEDKERREKPAATPSPSDSEMMAFIQDQWDDEGNSPQRFELFPMFGQGAVKRGQPLERKDWKGNPPKLTNEEQVSLANKFHAAAQRSTNTAARKCKFTLNAYDERRGSDPVGRYEFALRPNERTVDGDDGDGDAFGSDILLRRLREMIEDNRFERSQSAAQSGDVIKTYQGLVEQLMKYNVEFMRAWVEQTREAEAAKSAHAERDLAVRKQEWWLDKAGQAGNMFMGLLPTVVEKVAGKPLLGAGTPGPTLTIRAFLQSCSQEQKDRAFGKFEQQGDRIVQTEGGIFSYEQAAIIDGVATGKMDPSRIFDLMEGGAYAITPAQFGAAAAIFTTEQLTPLGILFKELETQRAAAAAPTQKSGN